jgi:hypothetical protein
VLADPLDGSYEHRNDSHGGRPADDPIVGVDQGHWLVEYVDNFAAARRLTEQDQIDYEWVAAVPERQPNWVGWQAVGQLRRVTHSRA